MGCIKGCVKWFVIHEPQDFQEACRTKLNGLYLLIVVAALIPQNTLDFISVCGKWFASRFLENLLW